MAAEQNLIPMSQRSKDEVRELAAKGGRKSGETRRRKKTMRENLEMLLTMPLKTGKVANIDKSKAFDDFNKQNLTVEQTILIAQIKKAMKGDLQAFEAIRDLIGERPVQEIKQETTVHSNPFEGLTTEELKKMIEDE